MSRTSNDRGGFPGKVSLGRPRGARPGAGIVGSTTSFEAGTPPPVAATRLEGQAVNEPRRGARPCRATRTGDRVGPQR